MNTPMNLRLNGWINGLALLGMVLLYASTGFWFVGGSSLKQAMMLGAIGLIALRFVAVPPGQRGNVLAGAAIGLAFTVYFLCHAYVRQHQIFDTQNLLFWIINVILFVFGFALPKLETDLRNIPTWMLLIAAILALASAVVFLGASGKTSLNTGAVQRELDIEGAMTPVGLAVNFGYVAAACAAVAMVLPGLLWRLIWSAAALAAMAAVLSTGSRGPLLWFAVLVVILFSSGARSVGAKVARLTLVCLVVGAVFGLGYAVSQQLAGQPHESRIAFGLARVFGTLEANSMVGTLSDRDLIWNDLEHRMNEWMVFGDTGYLTAEYPHNQLLEWVYRYGLVGLIAAAVSLAAFFRALFLAFATRSRVSLSFVVLALFLFNWLISMFSTNLDSARFLFAGFGLLCAMLRSRSNRLEPEPAQTLEATAAAEGDVPAAVSN